MSIKLKENWDFRTNISWNMLIQTCLAFLLTLTLGLNFHSSSGVFHPYDGLILLLFLYINYVPRFKINISHQRYDTELDLLFLTFIAMEIILFIGVRKINLGFHITPNLRMGLETLALSVIWISAGVWLSVKKGFITFAGWRIDKRRALLMIIPIFVMAMLEEIFFRGLLFNYLKQIFADNLLAAFLSCTLIFGLAHYKKRGWAMVLLATLAGIFYGLVYIRTGSIYCATFIHFATNTCWLIMFTNNASLQKRI
jgi:membrane protease YdiL (CAAX protease family)